MRRAHFHKLVALASPIFKPRPGRPELVHLAQIMLTHYPPVIIPPDLNRQNTWQVVDRPELRVRPFQTKRPFMYPQVTTPQGRTPPPPLPPPPAHSGFGHLSGPFVCETESEVRLQFLKVLRSDKIAAKLAFHCEKKEHQRLRGIAGILPLLEEGVLAQPHYSDSGIPYFAFPHITGWNLFEVQHFIGLFSPWEALTLLLEVTTILGECPQVSYGQDLVHGDIKPDNVFLDVVGRVWLIDFGIGRVYADHLSELDNAGISTGTLEFMPMEQLACSPLTRETDTYALGLTLYLLLTGLLIRETAEDHLNERELPPHDRIPLRLLHVLRQMTRRHPANRPPFQGICEAAQIIICEEQTPILSSQAGLLLQANRGIHPERWRR